MTRNTALPLPLRMISGVTAIAQILTAGPAHVWAQDLPAPHLSSGRTDGKISEARIVKVAPAHISDRPSAAEIVYAKVFPFPLIPIGTPSDDENMTVAKAVIAFRDRPSKDDMSQLRTVINARLWSAWTPSLLHQLGVAYLENGYFSLALDAWEQAWEYLNKGTFAQGSLEQSLADEVFSRLITANLRLGQKQRVRQLIEEEVGDSKLGGPATQALNKAMELLHYFDTRGEENASCGIRALNTNGRHQPGYKQIVPDIDDPGQLADYIANGISLPDVVERAAEGGANYQMAFRTGNAEIPVPAVIHWKFGHYSAVTERNGDLYRLEDPYLGFNNWVSAQALTAEGSGYYLVPKTKTLPAGWRSVSSAEGQKIRGRHCTHGRSEDGPVPDTDCPPNSGVTGLARYSFELLQAGLIMRDIPIGYRPPRGPSVYFDVKYRQRMSFLPSAPTFSNFGKQWTCNWISFIQPTSVTTGNPPQIRLITGDATAFTYNYDSASDTYKSANSIYYGMTIRRNTDGSYEISNSDGSKQVFAQPDSSSPARVFLTAVYDAAGNGLTLVYDGHIRLWKIYDALGSQATELFYQPDNGSIVDYQVRRIRDPFGREALFAYNDSRQLQSITDVAGLTSTFQYDVGDFINRLTTPYGATAFITTASGYDRSIEAQDPAGAIERAQATDSGTIPAQSNSPPSTSITVDGTSVPFLVFNGNLAWRNSYYWNKKTMADSPGDYNKAVVYHWLADNSGVTQPILESYKQPLEERVWFNYPDQTLATAPGSLAEPSKIARVIETANGPQTQLTQIFYNAKGLVSQTIDPLGRKLTYDYDPNNLLDVLQIRQNRGVANETVFAATYNNQHRPLTVTDAAGQVATYTYNGSGQVLTETRVRNGANETTTWTYGADGYLQSVTGPLPGSSVSFDYDGYGRIRTVTDSVGYALVYDYDNLDRVTKVTFPDGTFQQTIYNRLDPEQQRDRLGRWTYSMHDAFRHPVWVDDALGRTTSYDWCTCGSLNSITDGNGHKTSFTRDLQYRLTGRTYADNASLSCTYETASGRLKSVTDAKGQVTNYQYYIDDNLKQISYTDIGGNPPTPSVSFTYDPNYNRVASMTDGTGTTGYSYIPIVSMPSPGAGRLASVDGPLIDDTITYSYDEYGRMTNRSINGAANSIATVYDPLGRATSVSNPLGSFNYAYVTTTPRLDHVDYPNGQTTQHAYYGNTGDQRLQQIWNKTSSGSTISKFDHTYNAFGDIMTWSQQTDASTPFVHSFGYDGADQLLGDTVAVSGATQHQYSYAYDKAGNRTIEQIDSSVVPAGYNNLNQLTSRGGNGQMIFEGTLSEPGTVAIAGGSPAPTDGSNHFRLAAPVTVGSNLLSITATDASGNMTSQHVQLTLSGNGSQSLTYDLNGNMVSDGEKTYEWDAVNRLTAITSGTHRSEFSYNGLNQRVKIVEKDNGAVTSTKNLVWSGAKIDEERNASNNVTKRYYPQGMQVGSTNYYYTRDHLGSVRELTDGSGAIQTRYDYDPYGRRTRVSGSVDTDFGFTGHYFHQPSALNLALYRAYDAASGRWISRDPIRELGGPNLYAYVANDPIDLVDPLGLKKCVGKARVLGGNPATVGGPSGFPPDTVKAGTAAVDPTQWGGKSVLQPNIGKISGTFTDAKGNKVGSFSGISDVIGGTSPVPGIPVRDALRQLNPGDLIVELVTGKDLGVADATIEVPDDQPCPEGTKEQKCP